MRLHRITFATVVVLRLSLMASVLVAQNPTPVQKERDLREEKYLADSPAATPEIPRGYAVVIGIGRYENLPEAQQLRYAERDAEAIYSILISLEGGSFPAENVHKLIGANATLVNIRYELEEWLPSVAKPDDRVLIYFAGHGFVSEGKPYLSSYDLKPGAIAETAYPMDTLGRIVGSRIQAKWKVLLTDACHSGAINPDADIQTINRSLTDLSQSVFSLTASRDRERSFESADFEGGHGIFTYYVVKGLGGAADEDRDGKVTADELAEYVRRNVRDETRGLQNPTSERASFDPNMLLAFVPSNVRPDAPRPPKFGTLVIETNRDGVEVFVDNRSVGVINKSEPLRVPGLTPGIHMVKAVKMGYEPDGPREEIVYPGQDSTVSVKVLVPQRRSKDAVDLFEKGLEHYTKGFADDYPKAAELFRKALAVDPKYSLAALYLGRTYNALFDQAKSKQYFQRAIDIDPDFMEARASYGGMLLDIGDMNEAIRQLNTVLQRNPNDPQTHNLLAQAFCRKEAYAESGREARKAIQLASNNAEPHFWLAESLRKTSKFKEAKSAYLDYVRLSDFDSKLSGKLNYYVLGFLVGNGKKHRAAQHDIWEDLRSMAYLGLCDCERKLGNFDAAIANCQKSLGYDRDDPYTHYALGLAYLRKAASTGSIEALAAARKHVQAMLDINSDITEAIEARKIRTFIEGVLNVSSTQKPGEPWVIDLRP